MTQTQTPEMREKAIAILRETLPVTCGRNCEAEWTEADEADAYADAADAVLALSAPSPVVEGRIASVAESGGTALPKSDNHNHSGEE